MQEWYPTQGKRVASARRLRLAAQWSGNPRFARTSLRCAPLRRLCAFGATPLGGSARLAPHWAAASQPVGPPIGKLEHMKLFDEIERNNYTLAQYAEPQFAYLNRTGRVEFARIRRELEEWFARYPASGQAELRARFRSNIDSQHQAAFFELFLHEMLLRLGCQVTLHPTVSNVARAPDFLVKSPDGKRFYIEATIATNESAEEAASRARMNAVYDVLNRVVDSPDFFLWIRIEGAPTTPPPARKIASFVSARLAELDPDQIAELYESGRNQEVPRWRFEHGGWKIEFEPIPKKPEARGKPGIRPIGALSTGVRWVDHRTPIGNAIIKKAGRYGNLDLPYVVAVNVLEFIDEIDIMEALFGKEQFTIVFSQSGPTKLVDTRMSRFPDGAWIGTGGPRYTRVSAVLLATRLSIYNIPRANLCLYHNPWAQMPYQSVLTRLPQAVPKDNHMQYIDGESTGVIFGLPISWPDEAG